MRSRLNAEVLARGVAPAIEVAPGTVTAIATGGVLPRGADAVAMIEWTELAEDPEGPAILLRRAVAPGQFIGFAGSDIARGGAAARRHGHHQPRDRHAGRGGARSGAGGAPAARRGDLDRDELVPPAPLPPGGIPDSNAAILCAAVTEACGEPLPLGIPGDEEAALAAALRDALARADVVVLSGGTSKGAGDVHRVLGGLAAGGGGAWGRAEAGQAALPSPSRRGGR